MNKTSKINCGNLLQSAKGSSEEGGGEKLYVFYPFQNSFLEPVSAISGVKTHLSFPLYFHLEFILSIQ